MPNPPQPPSGRHMAHRIQRIAFQALLSFEKLHTVDGVLKMDESQSAEFHRLFAAWERANKIANPRPHAKPAQVTPAVARERQLRVTGSDAGPDLPADDEAGNPIVE